MFKMQHMKRTMRKVSHTGKSLLVSSPTFRGTGYLIIENKYKHVKRACKFNDLNYTQENDLIYLRVQYDH
jgi:hypothetical protein